jgi:hypothetical protein
MRTVPNLCCGVVMSISIIVSEVFSQYFSSTQQKIDFDALVFTGKYSTIQSKLTAHTEQPIDFARTEQLQYKIMELFQLWRKQVVSRDNTSS